MVKANELRIGNWVKYMGVTDCLVKQTKYENSSFYLSCVDDMRGLTKYFNVADAFEPIPLTPEILEACGFELPANVKDIADGFFLTTDSGYGFRLQLEKDSDDLGYMCEHLKLHHIKNLHQLQNLYFALNGEELKVNLCPKKISL